MKKLLKSIHNLLYVAVEDCHSTWKHIVFTESYIVVITDRVILYFDAYLQSVENYEFLIGKYLSYTDLNKIMHINFKKIGPQKDGFQIDGHNLVPYTATFCLIRPSNKFEWIFTNENEEAFCIPIGYALYLLNYSKLNPPESNGLWRIDLKMLTAISKLITYYSKELKATFFQSLSIDLEPDTNILLTENVAASGSKNTVAICRLNMFNPICGYFIDETFENNNQD